MDRRSWLKSAALAGVAGGLATRTDEALAKAASNGPLKIVSVKVTPIALPDPPILAASGCHGPYFLRNIVEVKTDSGLIGIGETRGGEERRVQLLDAAKRVTGQDCFSLRAMREQLKDLDNSVYAGIELACLDAAGKATGRRLCDLIGGPVRDKVEFAAYLFYRYAADHPTLLKDSRLVDDRGRGDKALDQWGEVRSAESMADMAAAFRKKWGFRVLKLKAGVLPPKEELKTMRLMAERFGPDVPLRIDPNARWTIDTAIRGADDMSRHDVPLEYYEDPVRGQKAMAAVRDYTGAVMSTNMCVTEFEHIPDAVRDKPIDVVLGDHHGWGGISAFQELGRISEIFGWKLSQHSNNHAGITMAAMIHAGSTIPQLKLASDTHYVWLVEGADIIQGANLPIRNGFMKIPEGPGLGVAIDPDRLAKAHEAWKKSGMWDRDDQTTIRMIQPGWERQLF